MVICRFGNFFTPSDGIVHMRATPLLVALAFSISVSAEVASTNSGLFPSRAVVVVLTNGNQFAAQVTVTNTFTETVECRVYAIPITTNRAKLRLGRPWSLGPSSLPANMIGDRGCTLHPRTSVTA